MARAAIALLAGLLLPACGDGNGSPGAGAGANAGTLAYLVSTCRRVSGLEETVQHELRVTRGDETATVYSVGPLGPFASGAACVRWGRGGGQIMNRFGAFTRLGMTPDGSGIVFELNDETNVNPSARNLLPAEQRGMYYVRSDGSGLRPLGPPSRFPAYHSASGGWHHHKVLFAPGGRLFTYGDLGPDEDGQEAPQVFVRDVHTGAAKQLTRLPPVPDAGGNPEIWNIRFIDARTILFWRFVESTDRYSYKYVSVDLDGKTTDLDRIVELPDGTVITIPVITSGKWAANFADVGGEAENGGSRWEVFVTDGTNVLQLTRYNRFDTAPNTPVLAAFDGRVYFTASADPLGTNPSYGCQIFSIDPISRDTRQVTFFECEGSGRSTRGCFGRCRVNTPLISSATGTLYFESLLDPLGQNPRIWQVFAIEPDGSGLRQLTDARGFVLSPDGRHEVETVSWFNHAPYDYWTYD
jgi:hypothetical protein